VNVASRCGHVGGPHPPGGAGVPEAAVKDVRIKTHAQSCRPPSLDISSNLALVMSWHRGPCMDRFPEDERTPSTRSPGRYSYRPDREATGTIARSFAKPGAGRISVSSSVTSSPHEAHTVRVLSS